MKKIKLTQGKYALVDNEDFLMLSEHSWYIHKTTNPKNFYARTNVKGIKKNFYMHRMIMNFPKGKEIDHINGNKLDNRKSNLRICTRQENGRNINYIKSTSGYRGVYKAKKRWKSTIKFNGKIIYIGSFKLKEDGALAYNKKAKELFGKFVNLNII